jgi:hypothetical protein
MQYDPGKAKFARVAWPIRDASQGGPWRIGLPPYSFSGAGTVGFATGFLAR